MSRTFAIDLQNIDNLDIVRSFVAKLVESKLVEKAYVFAEDREKLNCQNNDIEVVEFPNEADNRAKCKNYITQFFKDKGFDGFLHVVEDNVSLNKDPTEYLDMLEHCMDVLDYDVYFSTTSDSCNYVYSKFNPRIELMLDSPLFEPLKLPKSISFTSHSNTAWITYNFKKIEDSLLKFNESFDVPMYYIIEFLARRRNTKPNGSLYFMNQYLSIPQEIGVFKAIQNENATKEPSSDEMQKEDAIFKSLNLNFVPDNNIDQLLVDVIEKLKSKI